MPLAVTFSQSSEGAFPPGRAYGYVHFDRVHGVVTRFNPSGGVNTVTPGPVGTWVVSHSPPGPYAPAPPAVNFSSLGAANTVRSAGLGLRPAVFPSVGSLTMRRVLCLPATPLHRLGGAATSTTVPSARARSAAKTAR